MNKSLPVYQLVIDDNDDSGISYVALVDKPAIQKTWLAFSQAQHQFKSTSEERRIVSGALMVPDFPIYRDMPNIGKHYVTFDSASIRKCVYKFFRQGFTANVNAMHYDSFKVNGVYMFESFIIDSSKGINTPKGFDKLPDGSWFGSYRIENDEIWNDFIKTGQFRGFSVEGLFSYVGNEDSDERTLQDILKILEQVKD